MEKARILGGDLCAWITSIRAEEQGIADWQASDPMMRIDPAEADSLTFRQSWEYIAARVCHQVVMEKARILGGDLCACDHIGDVFRAADYGEGCFTGPTRPCRTGRP